MKISQKRVDGFVKYFMGRGRMSPEEIPRRRTLENFTPEEVFQAVQAMKGKDSHDLVAFIRTCRGIVKDITLEEIQEAYKLMAIKDVLES